MGFTLRLVACEDPARAGEEIAVREPIVIGRAPDCAVVLADPSVSRRHARVEPAADGLRVGDLSSGGGVWIGEARVTDRLVRPGEQFRIGSSIFACVGQAAVETADAPADAGERTMMLPAAVPPPTRPPVVPPDAPIVLRVVEGADTLPAGTEFTVDDVVTVGRAGDSGIPIAERDVSRQHARLTRVGDGLEVADLGSSYGTWVGAEQIRQVVLRPGQRFRIGNRVTLELLDPMTPAARAGGEAEATPVADLPASTQSTAFISAARVAEIEAAEAARRPPASPPASAAAARSAAAAPPVPPVPPAPPTPAPATPPLPATPSGETPQRPPEAARGGGETVVLPSPGAGADARQLDEAGELEDLSARAPFLLDDPTTVWRVIEGGVMIFAVALDKGQPTGSRTHFLGVQPGQVMFGFDLQRYGTGSGFLAVARPGTKVRRIRVDRLRQLALAPAHRTAIAGMLDAWIQGLAKALVPATGVKRTDELALAADVPVELDRNTKATTADGVLWVDLTSGGVLFDDMATPTFTRRSSKFPLTPQSWIQPVSDEFGALALRPDVTADLLGGLGLWAGLDVYHAVVCECEFIGKKLSTADEYIRLQEKAIHSEAARDAAYDAIGSVLSSEGETPREFRAQGHAEAVFRACQLVAAAVGIEAREHPANEDGLNFEQLVAATAIASGFRSRVVALRGDWWRQDNGPLLGQIAETNDPVAILPKGARSYEIVDPKAGTRIPATAESVGTLSDFAYTLYAPFPDGELTVGQLVRFGARYIGKDLRWVAYMAVVLGVFGTVTPYITGTIFDSALPQADSRALLLLGVALVGSALASAAFQFVQGVATIRVQRRMAAPIQSAVWDRLLNLPVNFFRRFSAGDLSDRSDGIADIQDLIAGAGVAAILGSVSGLFYVMQMFGYSLYLAVLAIVLTAIFVGVNMTANYLQLRYQRREFTLRGTITGLVLNLLTGVTKLRVCGAEEHAFRVWAEQFAQQRRLTFTVGTIQIAAGVFGATYPIVCGIAIFYTVVTLQSAGGTTLTTGEFIAFNAAFGLFMAAMQALGDASLNLLRVIPIYERIRPILDERPEVDRTKAFPGKLKGAIELSRVSFRYAADGPWILKDISLKIRPGEMVAFVGSSGGGKSTLMRLMLGFELPTTGAILYDGQDLSSIDLRMLRQQLGVVLQTSRVMPTEIFRNIVGVSSKTIEEAWVAAEKAGLAEDIRQMPMGMHTYVSEGGGTLSGGQRQRMMIARAIVNSPKVLFLDEATSALDNRAQAIVTESMDRMDATRIVIAHRLSTIINADRICYLHGGQIVEQGTYDELMKMDGMFAAQARRQLA